MLQLDALNHAILAEPSFRDALGANGLRGPELERHVDAFVTRLRAERARRGQQARGLTRLAVMLDGALHTNALEHMDEPDYSPRGKFAIAQGLHLLNSVTGVYQRVVCCLEPLLRVVYARTGRPARVLEIACGAGGLSFALAKIARKRGIPVEVTGSDIVTQYISRAKAAAAATNLPLRFERIDAFDMQAVPDGAYDIAFIANSLHHLSPGQIARLVAETSRVMTTAFVGVDGYRGVGMFGFVVGTAAMSAWPDIIHDAVLSARKFYSAPELHAIATMGAPDALVVSGRLPPMHTTLTVRFDGGRL